MNNTLNKNSLNFSEIAKTILTGESIPADCFKMFYQYSMNNTLIAISQMRMKNISISPIASYGKWQSLKRYVKKGQTAIQLWMPVTSPKKDENPNC